MIPCTITYGKLRIDRDQVGNLVIARVDGKESVRLSRSEWSFVMKVAEIYGYPVSPPGGLIPPEST